MNGAAGVIENTATNAVSEIMEPVDIEVTEQDKENFKKDMKELFSRMDKDNSGSLERPEVILFMKALSDDLSDEHIAMIFDNLDTDGSNTIDLEEFMVLFNQISVAGWKPVSSESKDEVNEEEVHQLFNLIDTERTGYITPKQAKKAGELIRERFGVEEIDEWLKATDLNKDGVISYDEFKTSLQNTISKFLNI